MSKKKPATKSKPTAIHDIDKTTEYAVKHLDKELKGDRKKISLELGLSEAIVDSILDKPVEKPAKKLSRVQKMMSPKKKGVTIMSKAVSEITDEARKKGRLNSKPYGPDKIFRPNGDDE